MFRTFLYLVLVQVYHSLVGAARRVGGSRVSSLVHRLAVATRYVVFPEHGSTLSGTGPARGPSLRSGMIGPMPDWLRDDMRFIGRHIDPGLFPTDKHCSLYRATAFGYRLDAGLAFGSLMNACSHTNYDYCYAVPSLTPGVVSHSALSLVWWACSHGKRVLVLVGTGTDLTDGQLLPPEADVVFTAKSLGRLSYDDQTEVLCRFLLQANISRIHIFDLLVPLQVIFNYIRQLTSHMVVFIHVDDYILDHEEFLFQSLEKLFLIDIARISGISVNSDDTLRALQERFGISESLLFVLPFSARTLRAPNRDREYRTARTMLCIGETISPECDLQVHDLAKRFPDWEFAELIAPALYHAGSIVHSPKCRLRTTHSLASRLLQTGNISCVIILSRSWVPSDLIHIALESGIPVGSVYSQHLSASYHSDLHYRTYNVFSYTNISNFIHSVITPTDADREFIRLAQSQFSRLHFSGELNTLLLRFPGYFSV